MQPQSSRRVYLRLLSYVKPYWKVFLFAIVSMIISAIAEPAFPALLKPLLDGTFVKKDPRFITWMPFLLIAIFVVRGISSYATSVSMTWIANKIVMDLRSQMFQHILKLPTKYYDNHSTGHLVSTIAFNVAQVTEAATFTLTVLVKDSLTVLGLLAWILYIDWKLSLILFATVPFVSLLIKKFSKELRQSSRDIQHSIGEMTHLVEETVQCHKVIKIFGGQTYEHDKFYKTIDKLRIQQNQQTIRSSASVPIVQLLIAIALAIIVAVSTQNNHTTVGSFISFLAAMLMLFSPLKRLTSVNEPIQRGIAAAEDIFKLLDQKIEENQKLALSNLNDQDHFIQFKNVNFYYNDPSQMVLNQINLTVRQGETIALVGPSGGGKSTLVALLPRFYDFTSGEILLNHQNIKTIELTELRQQISLVSQDVMLFNDTIKMNILYGTQRDVSEEELISVMKMAYAWDFIGQLPEGLNTLIGENGLRLSGGQRQRLAIARALIKNAPILILDEATSALDTESERYVQQALDSLIKNRTTFIIAHRLSTVENADRIIVLEKGNIVEIGSHESLLNINNGLYKKLYQSIEDN